MGKVEQEKQKRRKVILSNQILPYFIAISDDLMFFIAISTLFLTVVKGLSASEIALLTTVTNLAYLIIQIPALKIIKKIGNIKSIRIGTIMLLASSVLITFGNNYLTIILGYILYQPAFIFKKMEHIVLKNNLTYLSKKNDYIKVANKAHLIYAVITMVIALMAGSLFAVNHYLPMYLCVGICVVNILLTFCIFDVGVEGKSENHNSNNHQKKVKTKVAKMVLMIFLSFGLLYPIINVGQGNVTLLIQYHLQEYFEVGLTATYLSFIVVTSRIARIFGNILFEKWYPKMKDKINLLLTILTISAFALVLLGACFSTIPIIKFIIMTLGFDLILAIRDPLDTYMTDLLLKNTKQEEQPKAISYLQLTRRLVASIISFIFSMLLTQINLFYIIVLLMLLAVVSLMINYKLYKMVTIIKQSKRLEE